VISSELLEAAQVVNPFGVPHGQAMPACEQVAAAVCNAGHDGATACNCDDKLKKLLKDFEDQRKLQQQKTGVVVASGKHNADLDTVALLLDKSFQDKTEKKESKTAKEEIATILCTSESTLEPVLSLTHEINLQPSGSERNLVRIESLCNRHKGQHIRGPVAFETCNDKQFLCLS